MFLWLIVSFHHLFATVTVNFPVRFPAHFQILDRSSLNHEFISKNNLNIYSILSSKSPYLGENVAIIIETTWEREDPFWVESDINASK